MSRSRDRRPGPARPATSRPSAHSRSWLQRLHATTEPAMSWVGPAGYVVLAIFAILSLAMVFGPHDVGDVFTETDFYGAYAEGARHWQRLHIDPSRYGVVGPVFELVLGLVGFVVPDLFVAAQLISVAAMTLGLLAWQRAIRAMTTPLTGLIALVLLSANAQLYRHAWAASTDALAFGLLGAGMAAALGALGRAGVLSAGLLVGLSFLTRYSGLVMLPVLAAALAFGWTGRPAGQRLRAAGRFVLGFAVIVAPWVLLSIMSGQKFVMQWHHNLAYDTYARWQGVPWDLYQRDMQSKFPTLWSVLSQHPPLVMERLLLNLREHAWFDMRDVAGWALVVPAAIGLLLAWRDGVLRRLLPLLAFAVLLYLLLVPIFHSPRYSMALLPAYAALAAWAFASPRFALPLGPRGGWLKPLLVAVPLVFALIANARVTARTLDQLPHEARQIAERARGSMRPGDLVLARKAHFAYHAGITPISFPFTDSLPQLGAFAQQHQVRWLYYSWLERDLRPQFGFLLDTTSRVPGLTVRAIDDRQRAVLYEIGPEFGRMPAWYRDLTARGLFNARAAVRVKDDDVRSRLILALWEREQGRPENAQRYLDEAFAHAREDAGVRVLRADNLLRTGRAPEAEREFRDLFTRSPDDPSVINGLAWSLHAQARAGEAAALWRPLLEHTQDATTLRAMMQAFTASGDVVAARAAAARLSAAGGTP